MAKMKKDQNNPKNPEDLQQMDQEERLGKKIGISQRDIELFKMSLLREMR